jgi:hypothetical protein
MLSSHEPAVGDLGNSPAPDVYLPAPLQSTPAGTGAGRAYVLNGNFKAGSGSVLLSRLDDPTPAKSGNFGGGNAGVGDLVGGVAAPANEMLIGVEEFTNSARNDVHVFNPATEQVLQTIPDPDAQTGSAFGGAIVPLGDINRDGFLDFATTAENFTGTAGTAEGRVYVLRSDTSPAPPSPAPSPTPSPPPAPGPAGPVGPQGTVGATQTQAGRTIELAASRETLRRGTPLKLSVRLEAFANVAGCQAGQLVQIQRRRPASAAFTTLATRRTSAAGTLSVSTRPTATYVYRTRVSQTERCAGAVSNRERVTVRR